MIAINDCYQFYKVGLSYVDRYPFSLIIINLLLQLMFEERIAMSSINLYFPAIMLEKKSCGCACAAVSYNSNNSTMIVELEHSK